MILYYSASGNTGYIARLLAKKLDDECIDLLERIRTNDLTKVCSKKPFIICTPVWKNPCAHCMACILNCPFEAIEYGNITQTKEKYNINKYIG